MTVSCKELITMFNKIGGILQCQYDTKECKLLPKNISCTMKKENGKDLAVLIKNLSLTIGKEYCIKQIYNDTVNADPIGFTLKLSLHKDCNYISNNKQLNNKDT